MTATLPTARRCAEPPSTRDLRGPHLRLPDERARLRAALRPARGAPATCGRRRARRPTSSCSTPARCGRTPTTGSTATSATCARSRTAHPGMQIAVGGCLAQKDRGEIVAPGARGSTSCSARTTSARCRCCWSGPGSQQRGRRSRSLESLEVFPSTLPTRRESAYAGLGRRSRSAATTPARSASCRRCAARRRTAGPATCSPRSQALVGRGRARGHPARAERQLLRRGVRRPVRVRQAAAGLRRDRRAWSGSASPARTRGTSPTT